MNAASCICSVTVLAYICIVIQSLSTCHRHFFIFRVSHCCLYDYCVVSAYCKQLYCSCNCVEIFPWYHSVQFLIVYRVKCLELLFLGTFPDYYRAQSLMVSKSHCTHPLFLRKLPDHNDSPVQLFLDSIVLVCCVWEVSGTIFLSLLFYSCLNIVSPVIVFLSIAQNLLSLSWTIVYENICCYLCRLSQEQYIYPHSLKDRGQAFHPPVECKSDTMCNTFEHNCNCGFM